MSRYIREPKRSFERVGGLKTRDTAVGGDVRPVPSRRAARAGHDNVVPCNVRDRRKEKTMSKNSCGEKRTLLSARNPLSRGCLVNFLLLSWCLLNCTGSDHIHRAKDDLPREIERGPELTIEDAERARIAPDGADGARESHERAHLVARGTGSEESGDLGYRDVCKWATGRAGAASARGGAAVGEHGGRYGEEGAHEPVQPVGDEESVQGREGLCVRDHEGHHGHREHAVRAHMRARDGDARDVCAVGCEDDVVGWDEEDGVRGGVFGGRAGLHGEDVCWGRCAAGGGYVEGGWDTGAGQLWWYYRCGD